MTSCNGTCVNLNTDSDNCGACGSVCGVNTRTCCGGGTCADTRDDSNNCGSCGRVCPSGRVCFHAGCCTPPTFTDCD
jgi:hypothetical protein